MDALTRAHGLTSTGQLGACLRTRTSGRRGVVQLRELAALVNRPSGVRRASRGHGWRCTTTGLPLPELNWWVSEDGVPTYRLDLAYPHATVAIEYDGEEFHSSEEDKEADARTAGRGSSDTAGW